MRRTLITGLTTLALWASPTFAQDATAGGEQGGGRNFQTADELLTALEAEGKDLRDLWSEIRYTKVFALAADIQQRRGELSFTREPREMFRLGFNELRLGTRIENDRQDFIFDGEELVEVDPDDKLMVRRRVVGPDQGAIDPFDLEKGPFPLPFGQEKDAILERYHASIVEPDEGFDVEPQFDSLANRVRDRGWVQLLLVPRGERPDFETDELAEIRLWYDPADERLLPKLGMTMNGLGDIKLMEFFEVRVNAGLDESEFFTAPPEGEGWDVVYQDMVVGDAGGSRRPGERP